MVDQKSVNYNYSPAEIKLLDIIRQVTKDGRPIDSATLHDMYYGDEQDKPWHGQRFVNSAMDSLRMKADHNNEPYMIVKSKRAGQKPIEFRIVERPKAKKKTGG